MCAAKPRSSDTSVTIGNVLHGKANQCAACAPFRDRYREGLVPIRLNDTGETIVLGATCLRRIMERYFLDNSLPFRRLTGRLARLRRTLLIDLAREFPAQQRGDPIAERAFLARQPEPALRLSSAELRLYLQADIIERKRKQAAL